MLEGIKWIKVVKFFLAAIGLYKCWSIWSGGVLFVEDFSRGVGKCSLVFIGGIKMII
jgi:hypothetical protein